MSVKIGIKNIIEKLRYIKYICSDSLVKEALENIDYKELYLKRRMEIELIKYKLSILLYTYYKVKYIGTYNQVMY